ncbi:hypothetical protein QYE76_007025 [Lolium multiflorum]|uniref:Uncharacterized protein n=1 Tax=Lolium multiflorum TaxID=4521 RepID=A0AAD8RWS6_LOLMU|nr:hypothetical protein QYE76_007025 [Lolium multiflorum]
MASLHSTTHYCPVRISLLPRSARTLSLCPPSSAPHHVPSLRSPDTPYARLLRTELFPDSSPNPISPNKADHPAPSSHFASADKRDYDDIRYGASSPNMAPRTVPKMPHKVLDAPSLHDDFYHNLIDWLSQNMLAVTKLCNMGPRDSVCAVHWTREGSNLAISTSLGDVQVHSLVIILHLQFPLLDGSPNMN